MEQYRDWNPDAVFYLQKRELERWGDWNSPAQNHLESLDRDIDIVGEMAAYREQFRQYNQWFIYFLRESHRQEIEERNDIVRKIKEAADSEPS